MEECFYENEPWLCLFCVARNIVSATEFQTFETHVAVHLAHILDGERQ